MKFKDMKVLQALLLFIFSPMIFMTVESDGIGGLIGLAFFLYFLVCTIRYHLQGGSRAYKKLEEDYNSKLKDIENEIDEKCDMFRNMADEHIEKTKVFERGIEEIKEGCEEKIIEIKEGCEEKIIEIKKAATIEIAESCEEANAQAEKMVEQAQGEKVKLGCEYLKHVEKTVISKLTPNNYSSSKKQIESALNKLLKLGVITPADEDKRLYARLEDEYKTVLRKQFQKEEQTRIKAQIREEEKARKELEREMKRMEAEERAIQEALDKALASAQGEHDAEVERLREKLQEAEERHQRAESMAQLTKAGHVYVISNIGSFGERVFKIGMTRRLEPLDRVKELGDASVPFPFDVHMMISSEDAPSLENALHKELNELRLNKVNLRKEFFKVDIEAIREIVERNCGNVDYVAEPEALEYRESVSMSDDDFHMIEREMEALEA